MNPHNVLTVFSSESEHNSNNTHFFVFDAEMAEIDFFLSMILPSKSAVFSVIILSSEMYQQTITSTVRSDSNIHGWEFSLENLI